MEFKGTKGKWEIALTSNLETKIHCGEIRVAEAKHYNDGSDDFFTNDPVFKEGKANALLISKAPEMLEALLITIEELEDIDALQNHRDYLCNLIKEATGI